MNLSPTARAALVGWLASMLASMTIFPLVQGRSWYLALGFLAALVAGAGLVVRRFTASTPVVVAVQVVVWVAAVCAIFVPDTATFGLLPGPDAIASGRELLAQGLTVMHRAAPPVPDTPGVVFVTATGLGLIALLVDVVAVSLRRPAVAGLPLLAVYCVPAAVLPDGLDWPLFLIAGVGFLVLVAADSVDRVQAWGRLLGGGRDGGGRAWWGLGFDGARRVASVSLALAIVVPALVPGLGERTLTGFGNGHGKGHGTVTVINPLLQLRQDLENQDPTPVITYRTTVADPQPLRIVVDDVFTGDAWQPSSGEVPRSQRPQVAAPLAPGLSGETPVEQEQTSITVGALAQNYLPLPYPWRQVNVDGSWYYDAATRNVVGDGVTSQNLHYTVDHYLVTPSRDQLENAPEAPYDIQSRDLQLPRGTDPQVRQIARQHAGNGTYYQMAEALRNWLRTFTYSTVAPTSGDGSKDSSTDAILAFLDRKSGYCVHFASAMAVMARELGIPARVAVGFLPGTRNADGSWTITLKDAHAWPELYFQGAGWVRFEPTPAARTGGVADVVGGGPAPSVAAGTTPSVTATGPTPSLNSKLAHENEGDSSAAGAAAQASGWRRVVATVPWRWLGVALAVLLLLATPLAAAALARRSRWRSAATRQARAEAALEELGERLADLAVPLSPSLTPRGLRQWLVGAEYVSPEGSGPLDRLVAELESARYAPPGGSGPDADDLRADVRAVSAAVATQVTPGRRRLARFLPPTGVAVLTGVARRADAAAEGAGRRAAEQVNDEVHKLVGGRRR